MRSRKWGSVCVCSRSKFPQGSPPPKMAKRPPKLPKTPQDSFKRSTIAQEGFKTGPNHIQSRPKRHRSCRTSQNPMVLEYINTCTFKPKALMALSLVSWSVNLEMDCPNCCSMEQSAGVQLCVRCTGLLATLTIPRPLIFLAVVSSLEVTCMTASSMQWARNLMYLLLSPAANKADHCSS